MKKRILIFLLIIISLMLVSCGKKTAGGNDIGGGKGKTIHESYEDYLEKKQDMYGLLNTAIDANEGNYQDSIALSMSLISFAGLDYSLVPLTFCGLDEASVKAGLLHLYGNIDYKSSNNSCTMTFTNGEEKVRYESIYDSATDSVQTKIFNNDKLVGLSEYVKIGTGYASQYYFSEENATIYKAVFDSQKMSISMKNSDTQPSSIYKTPSAINDSWVASDELYVIFENGETTVINNNFSD